MVKFKNQKEKQLVENILFSIAFNCRFGCIPSIELSRTEYIQDILNTCLKQGKYYVDLINKTSKKTKKYQDYTKKLEDINKHSKTLYSLLHN